MVYNAYYAEVAVLVALLAMGIRLRRLGARTGESPERMLGAAFLLWALGYALYDLPYVLVEGESARTGYFFCSRAAINLGTLALALFTRDVFRPGEAWAGWLVAATAAGMLAGMAGSAWLGDWLRGEVFGNPWYWVEFAAVVAPSVWMAAEGLHEHRRARQRQRLGLGGALACNRFLLWGLAGALWAALELAVVVQEIEYALAGRWSTWTDLLVGALELAPVSLVWLAFFPPACYRGFVEARAARADEGAAIPGGSA